MIFRLLLMTLFTVIASQAQTPPIVAGVSHDLARWRAAHYSDVRYKLDLTLEKMSPVLKGTIEIRVRVVGATVSDAETQGRRDAGAVPLILDWRRIRGSESLSTISNVTLN